MYRKLLGTGVIISMIALSSACKPKFETWQPQDAPKQVRLGPDDKVFIMPVENRVDADPKKSSKALLAAFAKAFGTAGVPGQPLLPTMKTLGIDSLTYLMPKGMVYGAFVLGEPTFAGEYAKIPEYLGKLFGAMRDKTGFSVRYIAVAHLAQKGLGGPAALAKVTSKGAKVEAMGGLYDVERNTYVTVVRFERLVPADKMEATVGAIGLELANLLLCPSQDKECKDQAPEKVAPAGSASYENLQIWQAPASR